MYDVRKEAWSNLTVESEGYSKEKIKVSTEIIFLDAQGRSGGGREVTGSGYDRQQQQHRTRKEATWQICIP